MEMPSSVHTVRAEWVATRQVKLGWRRDYENEDCHWVCHIPDLDGHRMASALAPQEDRVLQQMREVVRVEEGRSGMFPVVDGSYFDVTVGDASITKLLRQPVHR